MTPLFDSTITRSGGSELRSVFAKSAAGALAYSTLILWASTRIDDRLGTVGGALETLLGLPARALGAFLIVAAYLVSFDHLRQARKELRESGNRTDPLRLVAASLIVVIVSLGAARSLIGEALLFVPHSCDADAFVLDFGKWTRDEPTIRALASSQETSTKTLDEISELTWRRLRTTSWGLRDRLRRHVISVRELLAKNPHTPPAALQRLAQDSDTRVLRAVAGNPGTPTLVLVNLAAEAAAFTATAIGENPSTPTETRISLLDSSTSEVVDAGLRGFAGRPQELEAEMQRASTSVRIRVAANGFTPRSVLSQLAHDPSDAVREAVAFNPSSPRATLEGLSKDGVDSVAAKAKQILHELDSQIASPGQSPH